MTRFFIENKVYFIGILTFLGVGLLIYANIDKGDAILFFSEHRFTFFNLFFRVANACGEGYAYLIIGTIFLFINFRNAITIGFAGCCTLLLSRLLKNWFGQPRPSIYFSEIQGQPEAIVPVPDVELVTSWTSSFPSGHTMAAFALYGLLAFYVKRNDLKLFLFITASLAGISRIYLGQHFLEDVLGGAFFGTLVAVAMFALQGIVESLNPRLSGLPGGKDQRPKTKV